MSFPLGPLAALLGKWGIAWFVGMEVPVLLSIYNNTWWLKYSTFLPIESRQHHPLIILPPASSPSPLLRLQLLYFFTFNSIYSNLVKMVKAGESTFVFSIALYITLSGCPMQAPPPKFGLSTFEHLANFCDSEPIILLCSTILKVLELLIASPNLMMVGCLINSPEVKLWGCLPCVFWNKP